MYGTPSTYALWLGIKNSKAVVEWYFETEERLSYSLIVLKDTFEFVTLFVFIINTSSSVSPYIIISSSSLSSGMKSFLSIIDLP